MNNPAAIIQDCKAIVVVCTYNITKLCLNPRLIKNLPSYIYKPTVLNFNSIKETYGYIDIEKLRTNIIHTTNNLSTFSLFMFIPFVARICILSYHSCTKSIRSLICITNSCYFDKKQNNYKISQF